MLDALFEILKKQRMVWSWAVIVGLFLIVAGHAPALPVAAGCLLAVGISILREWLQRMGKAPVRGT
jgi:predicted PurR-regulated permease PerM